MHHDIFVDSSIFYFTSTYGLVNISSLLVLLSQVLGFHGYFIKLNMAIKCFLVFSFSSFSSTVIGF